MDSLENNSSVMAKENIKTSPKRRANFGGTMEVLVPVRLKGAEVEAKDVAIERKARQNGKTKSEGKDFGKKGKHKGNVDSQQCKFAWNWARECPNRMVQQVQFGDPGKFLRLSYPCSTTTSTVRRLFSIPCGLPIFTSSLEVSVRLVSAAHEGYFRERL